MTNKSVTIVLMAVGAGMLTACVSLSQEPRQVYSSTDEFLGFTPWQKLELNMPAVRVSMIELIANGDEYNNQYIQTQGFLHFEMENGAVTSQRIYPSRESFEYQIYPNRIEIGEILPECYGVLETLNGEFIQLTGIYRHSRKMMSPIDYIRLIQFNEEKGKLEEDQILCKDLSIIFREKPSNSAKK